MKDIGSNPFVTTGGEEKVISKVLYVTGLCNVSMKGIGSNPFVIASGKEKVISGVLYVIPVCARI